MVGYILLCIIGTINTKSILGEQQREFAYMDAIHWTLTCIVTLPVFSPLIDS